MNVADQIFPLGSQPGGRLIQDFSRTCPGFSRFLQCKPGETRDKSWTSPGRGQDKSGRNCSMPQLYKNLFKADQTLTFTINNSMSEIIGDNSTISVQV